MQQNWFFKKINRYDFLCTLLGVICELLESVNLHIPPSFGVFWLFKYFFFSFFPFCDSKTHAEVSNNCFSTIFSFSFQYLLIFSTFSVLTSSSCSDFFSIQFWNFHMTLFYIFIFLPKFAACSSIITVFFIFGILTVAAFRSLLILI